MRQRIALFVADKIVPLIPGAEQLLWNMVSDESNHGAATRWALSMTFRAVSLGYCRGVPAIRELLRKARAKRVGKDGG